MSKWERELRDDREMKKNKANLSIRFVRVWNISDTQTEAMACFSKVQTKNWYCFSNKKMNMSEWVSEWVSKWESSKCKNQLEVYTPKFMIIDKISWIKEKGKRKEEKVT